MSDLFIEIHQATESAGGRLNEMESEWRLGMSTLEPKADERIVNVCFTDDTICVDLLDGRTIIAPLAWYPRLLHATPAQRTNWQLGGAGYGIYWPDIDEDLSVRGLLQGAPASRLVAVAA